MTIGYRIRSNEVFVTIALRAFEQQALQKAIIRRKNMSIQEIRQIVELCLPYTDGNRYFPKGMRFRVIGHDGPLLELRVFDAPYRITVSSRLVRNASLN